MVQEVIAVKKYGEYMMNNYGCITLVNNWDSVVKSHESWLINGYGNNFG